MRRHRRKMPSTLDAARGAAVSGDVHTALAAKHFARRLHETMLDKDLNQSDIARAIWGEMEDPRGYKVARNRDRVSVWLKGDTLPDDRNLKRLAEVLEVDIEDLCPEVVAMAASSEQPELSMTMAAGHPDKVYLQVNRLVSLAVAVKVMELLSDDKPKNA